mgnify:CR=1 FL=1
MLKTAFGLITAGVGGLYTVLLDEACDGMETVACRAKGAFRHAEQKPLVGDRVEVRYDDANPAETAVIREILARKNALIRPPMANLDTLFIMLACASPAPILPMIDKLICIAEHNHIEPVILIGKRDLNPAYADELLSVYRNAGFAAFCVSSQSGEGADALKDYIQTQLPGRIAAFAGASGVGKSTLLNMIAGILSPTKGKILIEI